MAAYVYGNAVRKAKPAIVNPVRQPKRVSRRVRENRNKAMRMSKSYVAFLATAAIIVLFVCVKYLQLQSEITGRSSNITALQQELADVKEANTTRYNVIMNSMNMEEIRDIAMNQLGMVYAQEDQIVKYQSPDKSAVTQYWKIPKSGIIASSDEVK